MDAPTPPIPRIIKETKILIMDAFPGIICTSDPNNCRHFFLLI